MGDRTDQRFEGLLADAVRSPTALSPGTRLSGGRYVIRRLLGTGGMGVACEATDTSRNASVVIKTLTQVTGAAIYQLKREFRTLAGLVHPNLVGLYELTCDGDVWFITMDYVPGSTLLQYARRHRDWTVLQSVFVDLATAIGAIHDAGLLHRDLKPSNVMVTPEGQVVILDFGLACQATDGDAEVTQVGSVSGTPLYMAPEQAAGEPINRASDWYAYGAMLFEALCGRPPFDGDRQEVMAAKQSQPAPRPVDGLTGVPEEVRHLCEQLLSRDPQRRAGHPEVSAVLPEPARGRERHLTGSGSGVFVGRSRELDGLRAALEQTNASHPVAALIHGVSGIGKTALER